MIKSQLSMPVTSITSHLLFSTLHSIQRGIVIAEAYQTDFPLIFVNKAFEQLTGYSTDDLLGRSFLSIFGDDQPDATYLLRQAGQGADTSAVLRTFRKDGTFFWDHITLSPIYDIDHTVTHYVASHEDVTGQETGRSFVRDGHRLKGGTSELLIRKQVETLQRSFLDDMRALQKLQLELSETEDLETLYKQIIDLTQQRLGLDRVGLFVLDDTRTQLLGTYGVAPDGVIRDEHYYQETITPNHWTIEVLNAPDHVKFWDDAPIHDNNQAIGTGWKAASALWNGRYEVGYLVIDNFMTRKPARPYEAELLSVLGSTYGHLIERKLTERALRTSENMLKNIIENIPFRVFWKDNQSVYRGCNSLHARGNGLASPDELVGKTDFDFLPERAAEWERDDREIIESGQPKLNVEELIVDADGSQHWLRSNKVALRASNGQATGILVTVEDITERKQVEAALVESENRYRIISEMISDYAFALDIHPDGTYSYAWATEDAVQRLTGYSYLDLANNFRLYHPDDAERAEQDFEKTLRGESTSGEYRIITKAGETRWIRLQQRSEQTTEDQVVKRVYAVAEDITKRKQAEAALEQKYYEERAMQNFLKVLHDVTIQLTGATTLDEFFRLVVQFGLEQFGFERIALLLYETQTGTTRGTYGTDEKGQLIDEHELFFEASNLPDKLKATLDYDKRFALYDNVALYTRGKQSGIGQNAVAILGNEEPMGWIAVDNAVYGRPLTKPQLDILPLYALTVGFLLARKREEVRTLALTQRLDLATGAGSIGVWEMNVLNNTVIWDSRMFPLYGIAPESFSGTYVDWRSRIHPDDRFQLDAALQAVLNDEKPYDVEFRVVWPDESTHHIKGNAMVLRRSDGKPERVVGVNIDITGLKRSEEQLQQALVHEKELGELKSRFVSMASHEFRTPLAAILATTETLTIYREKMTEPQIDARLDKIRQQVGYMKGIMEDVLQLSRIQAGRVDFNPAKDNFDALCREIVEEFDSQELHHGRIIYEAKQPSVIGSFDRRLMRQAISNLISNGLKYSPQDKSIRVELTQDQDEIVLKVVDQGIGIPPDDLKRLFEPFHRAANVGAISGTGLGLSITKQAVELHGGKLFPTSEVGVGTTFTVVLPMNNETKVNND